MVIIAALIGNLLISVTKFIAATITGSAAMMSECIHSLVDTGNQILLLYGLKRAALPADEDFPFGYGKEIYFWSFIVAIMIFALGGGISIYQGIQHLQNPEPISNPMIENPHPDRIVTSLDLEPGWDSHGAPVVFAITAQPVTPQAAAKLLSDRNLDSGS